MIEIVLVADPSLPVGVADDAEIAAAAAALEHWINADLKGPWSQGRYAVHALPRATDAPAGSDRLWLVRLVANSAVRGALGYHAVDGAGHPEATVAVVDSALSGVQWVTVASHEIAEMALNRFVESAVLALGPQGLGAYVMEACDPCEVWSYPFLTPDGRRWAMSDFVLPAYFRPGQPGPYDHMGQVPAPLTPARGCRQTVYALGAGSTVIGSAAGGDAPAGSGYPDEPMAPHRGPRCPMAQMDARGTA